MTIRTLAVLAFIAGTMTIMSCASPPQADAPSADQMVNESAAAGAELAAETSNDGADAAAAKPGVASTAQEAFMAGGPRFVSAAAVADGFDSGVPIVFVDARPPMDYEFGHIPNAVNVPYFEPEKHYDSLPKDAWLVAYCECPHAEAEQVADALEKNGFTQVRVIDEGLQGWRDLGREIVGGTAEPNG